MHQLKLLRGLLPVIILFISGCANVKIYSDKDLKNQTGIKFYYSKPFLLVEHDGAKDVVLKTTVVYLPDLANPAFAKTIAGLGSSDLKLAFENGSIASYGVVTDSKIPETISSLTELVTGVGGLMKGKDDKGGDVEQAANVADMKNAHAIMVNVAGDLKKVQGEKSTAASLSSNQVSTFGEIVKEVDKIIAKLAPFKPAESDAIAAEIAKLENSQADIISIQTDDEAKKYNERIAGLFKEVAKAKELLKPEKKTEALFELYEILYNGATPVLKKVQFAKQ